MRIRQIRGWFVRLAEFFSREKQDREFAQELESHLEMHIEDNLRAGMTPEEARRQALIKLGGIEQTKERHRQQRGLPFLDMLIQDLRYGLRILLKTPAFTVVAVVALALGIGANSAIFTVINAVLLRPLPYQESERLMLLTESDATLPTKSIAYPNYLDWRAQNNVFENLGVFRYQNYTLTGSGEPERIVGSQVSADLFPALRVNAQMGRVFSAEEDKAGATPVVVISSGIWERRFGKDPGIIGRTLTLNSRPYTVIGIMPAGFSFPSRSEMWTPVGLNEKDQGWTSRGFHPGLIGIGRLKPDVTIEKARAEMETIAIRLEQQYPDNNATARIKIDSLFEKVVGDIKPALLVLLAAVTAVLLIACANVANLLLARMAKRQKEFALRAALGAGRFRLVRQLLTESVLLSLIGAGAGLLMARWGTSLIFSLIDPNSFPRFREINVDGRVLAFTFFISVLTGIIFGLLPAIQASRVSVNETLKESGRTDSGSRRQQRLRGLLVIAEMAATVVLLIGAGLLMKSFYLLQQVELGFQPENVLTASVTLPLAKYRDEGKLQAFFDQLVARMAALPGVQSAAATMSLPFEGGNDTSFKIPGRPEPPKGQGPQTEFQIVTANYFNAMGIRLMGGRDFTTQDSLTAPRVAVIDENFARKYWPGEDAIGKHIDLNLDKKYDITVVGVASDVKYERIDATDQRELIYLPLSQFPTNGMIIVMRTGNDPALITNTLRSEVKSLDPDQPVNNIRKLIDVVNNSIASQRLSMTLLGLFAAVALLLAAVGIYGVMAYSVTQRTQEIGIRIALGAGTRDVIGMVIKQGMGMAVIGLAIGLIGAFALTRAMTSLLFGVSARDPFIFIAISLLLTSMALLACYFPARRAAKVDPMVAIRQE